MKNIMLRATSAVLGTTAILLMALAAVVATSGTSGAVPPPVCPAEPQDGKCEGTCKNPTWKCVPGVELLPEGPHDICTCAPPKRNPDPI